MGSTTGSESLHATLRLLLDRILRILLARYGLSDHFMQLTCSKGDEGHDEIICRRPELGDILFLCQLLFRLRSIQQGPHADPIYPSHSLNGFAGVSEA